jgi:hypothetical protein
MILPGQFFGCGLARFAERGEQGAQFAHARGGREAFDLNVSSVKRSEETLLSQLHPSIFE